MAASDEPSHHHTLFDVFPERYGGQIIGLPDIVQGSIAAAAAQGIDTEAAVAHVLVGALQKAVGDNLGAPLAMLIPMLTKGQPLTPAQVLQAFRLISPNSVISSFAAKHEYRDKKAPRPVKEQPWLVNSPFDIDSLDQVVESHREALQKTLAIPPLRPVHPELLPGLFLGSPRPWILPESEGMATLVLADVLSRLMFNYSAFPGSPLQQRSGEADDLFEVLINGKTVTRLDDFLTELSARPGSSLRGGILKAPATFGTLFTFKHPAMGPDAPELDVPFTLFLNTDVACRESGKAAFVPMTHAGLFLKYSSPQFSFDCEYYLGSGGNAKFRSGNRRNASWYQPSVTANFVSLDELNRAVLASALYGNFLNSLAVQHRLLNGGYGANGICADSVAPIEKMITGTCTVYPILGFLSTKASLMHTLQKASASFSAILAESAAHPILRPVDAGILKQLLRAVVSLPLDGGVDLEDYIRVLTRMRNAIPWVQGTAPFRGADNAYNILTSEITLHGEMLKFASS